MTKRAVLYLRLSLAQDAEGMRESDSISRQRTELRALAEREGWEVVAELADDGLSGRKARANQQLALEMLRDRRADVLAVFKLDRWTREGLPAVADLMRTLEARPGALFVALRDGLRSDQQTWRMTAGVLSEVAAMEAQNTAVRVSAAKRANREAGRFTGGTVPFGYKTAARPEGGRTLVIDHQEAAIVRELADRVLAGESQTALLRDLQGRGVPTTRSARRRAKILGKPDDPNLDAGTWSHLALSAILTGEAVLGRVAVSKPVLDAQGEPVLRRSKTDPSKPGRTPQKAWDVLRDADGQPRQVFEPILSLATVLALRERIASPKERKRTNTPRRRRARLLSGIAYCAECNSRLRVTTTYGTDVYACRPSAAVCQSRPYIRTDFAEDYVEQRFLAVVGDWPHMHEVIDLDTAEADAQLADVEAAIKATTAELASDTVDMTLALQRLEQLKQRRSELRAVAPVKTRRMESTGETVREVWERANVLERQELLASALDHVALFPAKTRGRTKFDPDRLQIHWSARDDVAY